MRGVRSDFDLLTRDAVLYKQGHFKKGDEDALTPLMRTLSRAEPLTKSFR